jgi:ABC-type antimicrobial peptide transport system permease subunit
VKKTFAMILATCLGAVIGMTGSVFASQNELVQATFQKIKLIVNGEDQQLSSDPLVYKGITYLPVRSVFDAVGYEVNYDPSTKTINANDKIEEGAPIVNVETKEDVLKQIKTWEDQIAKDEEVIKNLNLKIEQIKSDTNPLTSDNKDALINSTKETIKQYQTFIDQAKAKINELKSK